MNPLERRVAKLEAQRTDAPRNLFIQIYGDDTVEAYLARHGLEDVLAGIAAGHASRPGNAGRHPRRLSVDLAAEFHRLQIFVAGDKVMNSNRKFQF